MGIWSFVKNAGKSVFGKAEAVEVPASENVKKEIDDLGLDATGLDIQVEGEKVIVAGDTVNQEVKEKVILAAGNLEVIAEVEDNAAEPDAREPVFHPVEKGDSLWAIAAKHLGNGAHY